jgi:hypothetical protein
VLRLPVVGSPVVRSPVVRSPEMRSGRLLAGGLMRRKGRLSGNFRLGDARLRGALLRRGARRDGRRLLPPTAPAGARFGRLVRFLRIAQDQAFPAAGLATA